jgi:S-adenosylmethionine/arginine decarboxylase-like enzyme
MTALTHKHLLMNLLVESPPRDHEELEAWLSFLIKRVDMKIAKAPTLPKNPMAYYCNTLGNQGATGTGILETSHTAVHTWDDAFPYKFDFDLYSCSDFGVEKVLTLCQCFDIIGGNYIVLNRNDQIKIVEYGDIGEDGKLLEINYGAPNGTSESRKT